MTRKESQQKVVEKIAKLLKLSQSPNEAEAMAAYEKAHALLKEYNLSVEDIHEKPDIEGRVVKTYGRNMKWKNILMVGVATANYCTLITCKGYGRVDYKLYGLEHNVRSSVVLYDYLESVIGRKTRKQAALFRNINTNEFRCGMALRLALRLKEAMEVETSECTALAVINTESERAAIEDCGPGLKHRINEVEESASTKLGYSVGGDVSLNRQMTGGDSVARRIGGVA